MPRPDRHNEIEMNLLKSGSLTYLFGGRHALVQAHRLAVFWAAVPHQIVNFEGTGSYFVVTLPLSEFLKVGLDHSVLYRVLDGELLIDVNSEESDEIKFSQWERELGEGDPISEHAARLEVHARLLRLARNIADTPSISYSSPKLSRADELACYIARNYHKPLTSSSIAEAIGIHRNYAMKLFREAFGTTMTSFITQHRISHAQRLLVTTDELILDIALAAGFQSLSRFNEAFKSACECSPREYRKAHRN